VCLGLGLRLRLRLRFSLSLSLHGQCSLWLVSGYFLLFCWWEQLQCFPRLIRTERFHLRFDPVLCTWPVSDQLLTSSCSTGGLSSAERRAADGRTIKSASLNTEAERKSRPPAAYPLKAKPPFDCADQNLRGSHTEASLEHLHRGC
jgi:hypothetical protein